MPIGLRRDESQPVQVATSADSVHRVLVLAEEGLSGDELTGALRVRAERHGNLHVMVVVPALASRLDRLSGDTSGSGLTTTISSAG